MHRSHTGVSARIGRKVLPQGDGIRVAESAAQIGLQTPPASREIGPYSTAGVSLEELAEADDFPNSTPWIFAKTSP